MPKLWLGIGYQKGVSGESIEQAIRQTLADRDLPITQVIGVASIDLKAQEPGIVAVCVKYCWQLQTYSADQLASVTTGHFSDTNKKIVARLVGTNSVAEAAAILASGQKLLVPKQICSIADKFITVAICFAK